MLTFAQKTSQVLLHMAVAFGVTYGFTGSLAVGGLAAVVEPVCNVLVLPLHDRAWGRLRRRLARAGGGIRGMGKPSAGQVMATGQVMAAGGTPA